MSLLCNVLLTVNCFLKNKPGSFPNAFSTFLSFRAPNISPFALGTCPSWLSPPLPRRPRAQAPLGDPVEAPLHFPEMSWGAHCSVLVSRCLLSLAAYVWGLYFLIVSKALFLNFLASSHLSVGCIWDPLLTLNFHTDVRLVLLYWLCWVLSGPINSEIHVIQTCGLVFAQHCVPFWLWVFCSELLSLR